MNPLRARRGASAPSSPKVRRLVAVVRAPLRWLTLPGPLTLLGLLTTSALAGTIDPWLLRTLQRGGTPEFFVVLDSRADIAAVAGANAHAVHAKRVSAVRTALLGHAQASQAPLRAWLDARGVPVRSFHIVNALLVRGDLRLARMLARRADVARLEGNPSVRVPQPAREEQIGAARKAIAAIEPGISATNAPALWALGITGQGIVVGSQDTGVTWDHAALKNQYLGWNGSSAAHDYHWHDSVHAQINPGNPDNPCGYNAMAPCDDSFHGTHTMGTAVGSDGDTEQIGMAPGARWIACRNMDQGWGAPAAYLECFEWFLAPYPVGGTPAQGDPARAPHVTINSWSCPPFEGCSWETLQQAVEAQRAAGIMTVVAAGNSGSACNTIDDPPALYDASYTIAAYSTVSGDLAFFSSRGNVTIDGSQRAKPDLAAPGVNVRSAIPGGYASFSGTSMATPHVAGAVALLWSAFPQLKRDIAATEQALNAGAQPVPLAITTCGTSGSPNALWGYGKLDVGGAMNTLQRTIEVTRDGSGSGAVTSSPAGIACGGACSASFAAGAAVTLSPLAEAGSIFTGWLGACTGTGDCVIPAAGHASVSATFGPSSLAPLRIDIDLSNHYDALTDGLMILRYLFDLDAASIAEGTLSASATLTDPALILARLDDLRPLLDADGNGDADALTDGMLILRYLFGLRGPALIANAIGPGATRTDAASIEAYIVSIRPDLP